MLAVYDAKPSIFCNQSIMNDAIRERTRTVCFAVAMVVLHHRLLLEYLPMHGQYIVPVIDKNMGVGGVQLPCI